LSKIYPIELIPPYLSVLLAAVSVIFYIFKRTNLSNVRLIALYSLFSIATDIFITPLLFHLTGNQFIGAKIFTLVEFHLIVFFVYQNLITKNRKKILISFISLFAISFLYQIIASNNNNFDSFATGVSSLLLLIISIYFLYSKVSNNQAAFNFDSITIIVCAFIIYFSGTFFIYIFSSNYINSVKFKEIYNVINSIVLIIRNFLILLAFFRLNKYDLNSKEFNNKLRYI
jgi:hypothetical protein